MSGNARGKGELGGRSWVTEIRYSESMQGLWMECLLGSFLRQISWPSPRSYSPSRVGVHLGHTCSLLLNCLLLYTMTGFLAEHLSESTYINQDIIICFRYLLPVNLLTRYLVWLFRHCNRHSRTLAGYYVVSATHWKYINIPNYS